MSLFHPPAWFPPQLAFIWPLIWVQVLMLRAQIRAAYGRGVKYHWSITPNLRVYLVSIDWIPGQKTERAHLQPAAYAPDRLAAACDPRGYRPAYLHVQPLLLGACEDKRTHCVRPNKGVGMRGGTVAVNVGLAGMPWPLTPTPLPGERGLPLPLPDT